MTNRRFGEKKIHERWKLNGNIFFELFLGDLDEKMTSAGYRRKRNKKESETVQRADNFQFVAFVNQIIKSLLLDNFSLRSQQMVPNYFLYPYKYPEFHLRKIWPQFWANRHFPDGDGHYGGLHTNWQIKALPMACNRQSSSWARILLLLILMITHSLTHSLTHSNR